MMVARVIEGKGAWSVKVYPNHEHAVADFGSLYEMACQNEQEADLLHNAWEQLDDKDVHNIRRRGIWPRSPWPPRQP